MSFTLVEKISHFKKGPIAIRPFFDNRSSNMGLEKYGLTLFEGVSHEEQLACLENNGVKRYLTGLNEFAPEIKKIVDPEEREARIKEIRTIVADLEKELAANVIDIEDKDFWTKVKLLRPDNDEFWNKITLRCGNDPLFLEPEKDPYDLIKFYAINAGGFSIVAKSYDDAKTKSNRHARFYLDKYEDTASSKTEIKKLRNRALSELQKLFDKNTNKLFYVAKVVDIASAQYKKSTPNDVVYDIMDNYINGDSTERNPMRAAQTFIDAANSDMETLKLKAMVKDATYYKFIISKADGMIYTKDTGVMLGRNQAEIIEYLRNPLNEDVLVELTKKVEKYWNQ
jgi:hypothetical protein